MANIQPEINAFKSAVYGEEVRDAMVSLANKVNDESSSSRTTVYEYENRLNVLEEYPNQDTSVFQDGFINTNGDVVDVNTITQNDDYIYSVFDCSEGDLFNITGVGNIGARLFCFIDSLNAPIYRARPIKGYALDHANIVAPKNARKLVINFNKYEPHFIFREYGTYSDFPSTDAALSYSSGVIIRGWIEGMYIPLPSGSEYINFESITGANDYRTAIIPCNAGDVFTISCTGSITARAYTFIDSNYKVLTSASSEYTASYTNRVIIAPEEAKYLILNDKKINNETEFIRKSYKGRIYSSDLSNDIFTLFGKLYGLTPIPFEEIGYYDPLEENWWLKPTRSLSYVHSICSCESGDEFFVSGAGTATAKLFTFFDSNNAPISYLFTIDGIMNAGNGLIRVVAPENSNKVLFQSKVAAAPMLFKKTNEWYNKDIYRTNPLNLNSPYHTTLSAHDYAHGTWQRDGSVSLTDRWTIRSKGFLPDNSYAVVIDNPDSVIRFIFFGYDDNNNIVDEFVSSSIYKNTTYPLNESLKYKVRGRLDATTSESNIDIMKVFSDKLTVMHRAPVRKNSELNDLKFSIERLLGYNYVVDYANANEPLSILNYYGNIQNVHPKVLYVPNGFAGHKFWMAYTPYPWANDLCEDPCVVYSDNGVDFYPDYVEPITMEHNMEQNTDTDRRWTYSDTHIVIVPKGDSEVIQCWWRGVKRLPRHELIYMSESTDGLTWGNINTIFEIVEDPAANMMSPVILYEDNKYKFWCVKDKTSIDYFEGDTPFTLQKVSSITDIFYFDYNDIAYKVWHIDIIHDGDKYIMAIMAKSRNTGVEFRTLFLSESSDGLNWSTPQICIKDRPKKWDECIYRSSIVRVEDELWIYYSAHTRDLCHNIGISKAATGYNFVGML